jgi:hypothetical protein
VGEAVDVARFEHDQAKKALALAAFQDVKQQGASVAPASRATAPKPQPPRSRASGGAARPEGRSRAPGARCARCARARWERWEPTVFAAPRTYGFPRHTHRTL